MSPQSNATRPVWVLSLPVVAIFISFLWLRKKRGRLQTDPGDTGEPVLETQSPPVTKSSVCVNNNKAKQIIEQPSTSKEGHSVAEEVVVKEKVAFKEVVKVLEDIPKTELVVDKSPKSIVENLQKIEEVVKSVAVVEELNAERVDKAVVEEGIVKTEAEEAVLTEDSSESIKKPQGSDEVVSNKSSEVPVVEPKSESIDQPQTSEEAVSDKSTEVVAQEAPVAEESNDRPQTSEEVVSATSSEVVTATATPKERHPEEGVKLSPGGGKWSKKKGGKKNSAITMTTDSSSDVPLDQQLAKLDIGQETSETKSQDVTKTGRDSANTSPSEVMLASPSLSGYSDTHSEGSSDSGKGHSDVLTPSPTPVSGNSLSGDLPGDIPVTCIYEFVIPQHLVGRLIGRNGSNIHEIKENTHASVYIKVHPDTSKLKICAIEGTQMDIDNALDMIRHKFPLKRYPNMTLEPIEPPVEPPPVLPENMQLYLVDGINNDVIISSLVSAGHAFLQQPLHPSFLNLSRLSSIMASCYQDPDLPGLPDDVQPGVLCVAPMPEYTGWFRAEVVNYPEGEYCDVRFVDYGGYSSIEKKLLKQIRADFVTLPFQAQECFLYGIQPIEGEEWSDGARELVEFLTFGQMLQAQVYGYTEFGAPLVYLYTVHKGELVLVNEQLVTHGFASWLLHDPVTENTDNQEIIFQQEQQSVTA